MILEIFKLEANADKEDICKGNIYYIVHEEHFYKINNCKLNKIKI